MQVIAADPAQAAALDAERAAGNARGPLHGIPILLKDNIGTNDMPTTAGSIALAENIPSRTRFLTSACATRAPSSSARPSSPSSRTGRPLTCPAATRLGGQVRERVHRRRPERLVVRVSGVAASMALASATIGTEPPASILRPSTPTALVGVKPTTGLVSRAGIIPIAASFDIAGTDDAQRR